jgi:uncharacterized membrane protein
MTTAAHLWAIGFDDTVRAGEVRDEVGRLGWDAGNAAKYLILLDLEVVVRHADGSFTLERERLQGLANILACTGAGFLAGLVVAAPLTGAAIGAVLGSAGSAAAAHAGVSADFIRDVKALMKPGTSVLFVLDDAGDMEAILHAIQGLGGTVLRSNVDLERVKVIQSALAAVPCAE